jgi:hypothetical protein
VVLILITAGADLEVKTEENLTVFDIAREHRNEQMIHLLTKLCHMKLSRSRRFLATLH